MFEKGERKQSLFLALAIVISSIFILMLFSSSGGNITGNALWDWDHCSSSNPCPAGEGDCDRDSECITGNCAQNVGANYGQDSRMDVCEGTATTCTPQANLTCYNGDVWWVDSCGNRESMRESCTYGCAPDGISCASSTARGSCVVTSTGITFNGIPANDYCNGSTLIDYGCINSEFVSTDRIDCPNGCSNGLCMPPIPSCGDGRLGGSESCDDGNTYSGDGCSSLCQTEPGWTCDLGVSPSVCVSIPPINCHGSRSIWNWDYCTSSCPCNAGEGDCDRDSECTTGNCAQNVGANYGQDSRMDVCEGTAPVLPSVPHCGDGNCDNNLEDCSSCPSDCGCTSLQTCVSGQCLTTPVIPPSGCHGSRSIWNWDYCTSSCPCNAGEGDCDRDSECTTGNCAQNVGANYGQDSRMDVCEGTATTCTPQANLTCYNGDVWWVDSCGNRESMRESCTYGCAPDGISCASSTARGSCVVTSTGITFNGIPANDYCNGSTLIDYGCINSEFVSTDRIDCPNGCSNGLCMPPIPSCGDGRLGGSESCDDGNTYSGDGCSSLCQTEPGWTCDLGVSPSVCVSIPPINCHGSRSIWNWDYCTSSCPCNAGEGDCDRDSECTTGNCAQNVGANYGQDSRMDVCEGTGSSYCGDGLCSNGETCSDCSRDCGVCGPSCGDGICEGSETSSNCPQDCGCTYDFECSSGLVCLNGVCLPPLPCTINSVWWSPTNLATSGEMVVANVQTINCEGQRMNFVVEEWDLGANDAVAINPNPITVGSSGRVQATWIAVAPDLSGETNPEYVFTAYVGGDSMTSNQLDVIPGSVCGNGACENGEDYSNCPQDCGCTFDFQCASGDICVSGVCVHEAICGDGICEGSETSSNCPQDCGCTFDFECNVGDICQNGLCVGAPRCGDASCDSTESCSSCPIDCGTCTIFKRIFR